MPPTSDPQLIRRGLLDVTGGVAQWNGNQFVIGSSRVVGWTVDPSSGISVPASTTEWNNFIAARGLTIAAPSSLWLCQETTGNLSDSIGALTLSQSTSPTYRVAVPGWTRVGVNCADGTNARFTAAAGLGPNPSTTSSTWMFIFQLPAAPAVVRCLGGLTTNNLVSCCEAQWTTSGFPQIDVVNVQNAGATVMASSVHPLIMTYNRTGSVAQVYSDLEKVIGTYNSAVVDGNKGIGGNQVNGQSGGQTCLYAAMWSGANGEFTATQGNALLQAQGFPVLWS